MTPVRSAMSETERVKRLAAELGQLQSAGSLNLEVSPIDGFALVACLQLAWRHPRLSLSQRTLIESFAHQLQGMFARSPVVAQMLEMGWDRSQDE